MIWKLSYRKTEEQASTTLKHFNRGHKRIAVGKKKEKTSSTQKKLSSKFSFQTWEKWVFRIRTTISPTLDSLILSVLNLIVPIMACISNLYIERTHAHTYLHEQFMCLIVKTIRLSETNERNSIGKQKKVFVLLRSRSLSPNQERRREIEREIQEPISKEKKKQQPRNI